MDLHACDRVAVKLNYLAEGRRLGSLKGFLQFDVTTSKRLWNVNVFSITLFQTSNQSRHAAHSRFLPYCH